MRTFPRSVILVSATFALFVQACGGSPHRSPATAPAPAPMSIPSKAEGRSAPERAAPQQARARWAARPSPATDASEPIVLMQAIGAKMRGPLAGTLPNRGTVLLSGATGVVDRGRRYVLEGDVARAIEGPTDEPLEGVVAVRAPLGGGYVFYGASTVYFAPIFEGPLRLLGKGVSSFTVALRSVFLGKDDGHDADGALIAMADGKPVPGAPAHINSVAVHPNGFMVAFVGTETRLGRDSIAYFSTDARKWQRLSIPGTKDVTFKQHDTLTLLGNGGQTYRVDAKGHVVTRPDGLAEARAAAAVDHDPPVTSGPALGALLDAGWVQAPRDPRDWFTIQDHQVVVARGSELRKVGAPLGPDLDCTPAVAGGTALALCVQLGAKVVAYALDIGSGTMTVEHEIRTTQGLVSANVSRGSFPATAVITSPCDGGGTPGYCIRGVGGGYVSVEAPAHLRGQLLPFPGEAFVVSPVGPEGMDVLDLLTRRTVHFAPQAMAPMLASLATDPKAPRGAPPVYITVSALRTSTGIRTFHVPNPMRPRAAAGPNVVVDLPLDGSSPSVATTTGVIASAGAHALRLDGGVLYESTDGWGSWRKVAPPPTGVPTTLDGAACTPAGCRLGAWARIGWDGDPRVP